MEDPAEVAAAVRAASGIPADGGPDDAHIAAAVAGFAQAFDYWYIRVIRKAVRDYRRLIVARINPFIRQIECAGFSATHLARRLVGDWNNRNFVTAGGWAIEEMAVCISSESQKSSAEGIDVQRHDPASGDYHLYVIKSGTVTRNSDVLKALKRNSRQAEKLLLQGRGTGRVHAYYAIAAGKTTDTFEDGIHRPSSSKFWSDMTGLPGAKALDLIFAVSTRAGQLVCADASKHVEAMEKLTAHYIARRDDPLVVDWDFLVTRTMQEKPLWDAEDKSRHTGAMKALRTDGYEPE